MHHRFDPAHMDRLLSAERLQWQNPEQIFARLGLGPGMIVADVGCGPGFFTLPAALQVGPEGRVFALDVAPAMLERVRQRAEAAGLRNVETILSHEDGLPLPDASVDLSFMINVLHECANQEAMLRDIARVLRPGGTFAVVEWRKEATEKGPPAAERLALAEVHDRLLNAGYSQIEPFEVGPYHYGVRCARPD